MQINTLFRMMIICFKSMYQIHHNQELHIFCQVQKIGQPLFYHKNQRGHMNTSSDGKKRRYY